MLKYKVLKPFINGPEVGEIMELTYDPNSSLSGVTIQLLLDGGYIVEEHGKWKPDPDEWYWTISGSLEVCNFRNNSSSDLEKIRVGNCFRTKADALKARDAIQETLKNLQV